MLWREGSLPGQLLPPRVLGVTRQSCQLGQLEKHLAESEAAAAFGGHPTTSFRVIMHAQRNIFLRDVFATHIPKLFEDCRCFKGAEGKCFIAGGGKRQPIDAVQYMLMGFPCKDVSSLNTNQRKHRDAIAQGKWCQAEKTGGVFVHGVLPYVTNHGSQLRALILENVLGLLIGNLYALACNM